MSDHSTEFVNTMVKAGAGAGKTYGLIQKIVDLVKEHTNKNNNSFPRFIVTTFTRKATQEVRERLLAKALEISKEDPIFGDLFLNFLKSSGLLMVSTIHGVLNLFLRQHGYSIGLDPDFRVRPLSTEMLNEVIHELLSETPAMTELIQKYGWRHIKFFLMEYHRSLSFNPHLQSLPEKHFFNHWEQKLNLLRQCSKELLLYIQPFLEQSKSKSLIQFNLSLREIQNILSEPQSKSTINPSEQIWNQLDKIKNIYSQYPRHLGALKQWDEGYKAQRTQLSEILSEINEDPLTNKENFILHEKDKRILQEIGFSFSQRWFKRKIKENAIEMEDLEFLSLYLLRRFPEVKKSFSESWNYWFIDEYQDTSPIQVEILNYLIGDCPHYVVGDPQQSIYFFRGARSKVFHEKLNLFRETSAKIEEKKINRRSQTPTLYFINDLMDVVNKHQFSPMEPLEPHSIELFPSQDLSNLNEKKLNFAGYFYLVPEDKSESAPSRSCLQLIEALQELLASGVGPSSIAILCRENKELHQAAKALQQVGLPAQVHSSGRFLEDRQVRDALALWKFLVNPHDDINLVELLRSAWFHVDDGNLLEVRQAQLSSEGSFWDALSKMNLPAISQLRQALESLQTESYFTVWKDLLINSGAIEDCSRQDMSGRKEGNLWKLIVTIHDEIKSGTINYLDPLNLDLSMESNKESEAQALWETQQIQLMTIHGSKGLEFDHVILPFLNHERKRESSSFFSTDLESQFWTISSFDLATRMINTHYFAQGNMEEINSLLNEESERLFYVAITRAKKSLHFFCPDSVDSLSTTGWAKHLKYFIAKGPGVYHSDSGSYQFQVKLCKDLTPSSSGPSLPQQGTPSLSPNRSSTVSCAKSSNLLNGTLKIKRYSVTELVQLQQQPPPPPSSLGIEHPLRKLSIATDWSGVKKGILVHREFERCATKRDISLLSSDLAKFVEEAELPLKDLLLNGYPEWSFVLEFDGIQLEGQVDLWGRDLKGHLWIVDYKTGSTQYLEKAYQQMQLYAGALHKLGKTESDETISLAVCFPSINRSFVRSLTASDYRSILFHQGIPHR